MTLTAIPTAALDKHIAILGKTGSGKTNAAKVTVERLLDAGERICILDPTAAWWGLRANAEGDGAGGYPVVVFGGEHGDVPLAGAHGAAIAEIVGTSSTPAVIDTRLMTVGERTRFFTEFAETLLRKNKGPLHLVIDEAHLFAPQGRVADPQSGKMLHAANNLVSLGRSIGLRVIMISQRPAKLHKDSLTQVETLVALRLIAPQDRRAVEDWIGEWADPKQGKDLIASLPSLPTGQGWIWSPELGVLDPVSFPLTRTFDSAKTPTGRARKGGPVLAPIDLDAVHARLEQVKIDAKANDVSALKRRIAELEKTTKSHADPKAEAQAFDNGERAGRFKAAKAIAKLAEDMAKSVARAEAGCADVRRLLDSFASFIGTQAPSGPAVVRPQMHALPPKQARTEGNGSISGPMQKILDAVAWWRALGHPSPSRVQVAFVAGYKPNTGTFNTYLGSLSTSGLITYPDRGRISLTDAGSEIANEPSPPTTDELRERVFAILSGPQARLLSELVKTFPSSLSRDDLAARSGYQPNTGTFNTYLGSLSTLGVIEYPQRGQVRAADWLSS